jgi:predicted PurR-regulated permease PerM
VGPDRERRFDARGALIFWAVGALVFVLLAVLRTAAQPLLLVFAGVLFGTALRGLAEVVATRLRWDVKWALAAVTVALLAILAALTAWAVDSLIEQMTALAHKIDEGWAALRKTASETELGRRFLDGTEEIEEGIGVFVSKAAGMLATAAGFVGAVVLVGFVALYTAASPDMYQRGVVHLVPPSRRPRSRDVLRALSSTLRRWLLGRMVSMTAVGVTTWIGLWLMGIPLPLPLGLIAGAFGFVPNIGPIVSSVPAILLALTVSPIHVVYVIVFYLAINLADGYVFTPWVQKRAVALPAALILSGQVIAGTLWGVLGVMFATPIAACLVVLVRELYVEDVLERGGEGDARRPA